MRYWVIHLSLIVFSAQLSASEDLASLDRLADIVTLPPVPWWPMAPGWQIVIVLLFVSACAVTLVLWSSYRRNAYRRLAIAELARVGRDSMTLTRITGILKRTALVTMPRRSVAALSGEHWLQWLEQASPGVIFSARSRQLLAQQLYRSEVPDNNSIDELVVTAHAWIRHHQTAGSLAGPDSRNEQE